MEISSVKADDLRARLQSALESEGFSLKRKIRRGGIYERALGPEHVAQISVELSEVREWALSASASFSIVSNPINRIALKAINAPGETDGPRRTISPGVRPDEDALRFGAAYLFGCPDHWSFMTMPVDAVQATLDEMVSSATKAASILVAEHPSLSAVMASKRFYPLGLAQALALHAHLGDAAAFEALLVDARAAQIKAEEEMRLLVPPGMIRIVPAYTLDIDAYAEQLRPLLG